MWSAAFVEFQIPNAIVASALSLSEEGNSENTSVPPRGIVFVPCSQDADVAGGFTLTVYSTLPLSWHTAPLTKLLNPKKALLRGEGEQEGQDTETFKRRRRRQRQWRMWRRRRKRRALRRKKWREAAARQHGSREVVLENFWQNTDDEGDERAGQSDGGDVLSFSSEDEISGVGEEEGGAWDWDEGDVSDSGFDEDLAGSVSSFGSMMLQAGGANSGVDPVGELAGRWHGGLKPSDGGEGGGAGATWGGCRNFETWLTNPSFAIACPEPSRLRISLACTFKDSNKKSGRPPAIGMYLLAGDEDTAVGQGSFVLARSGFSRGGLAVWEVDVPAAPVPWVLVACTYAPKVAGSFTVSVERQ
jgi:hypothetical protein